MPNSTSDSDDHEHVLASDEPSSAGDEPIPAADEHASAAMDVEGSSSHSVSWSYPPSPMSQLNAHFNEFRMDVSNELRDFKQDVQFQLDNMKGDIHTILGYYQHYPPLPPPPFAMTRTSSFSASVWPSMASSLIYV